MGDGYSNNKVVLSHDYNAFLYSAYSKPSPSQIHVNNLSFAAYVGANPWGSSGDLELENIHQPVYLSARVALRQSFETASANDVVDASTVHYGVLSKEILKAVSSRSSAAIEEASQRDAKAEWSVNDLSTWIMEYLVRTKTLGTARSGDRSWHPLISRLPQPPLLNPSNLRELELQTYLPKGSLKSTGVRLTDRVAFNENGHDLRSCVLRLAGMRIPTLIGVNKNERTATQMVIASVEIEPYTCLARDSYPELADIVFRSIEESSFETLETLGSHVVDRIIDLYLSHYDIGEGDFSGPRGFVATQSFHIKVRLEKPTAVTFADAPAVEVNETYVCREDHRSNVLDDAVPFPLLTGTLQQWLDEHNVPHDPNSA